jgi:hypothetical protein
MKKTITVLIMATIFSANAAPFPGIGKRVSVDFGDTGFILEFIDDKQMSFAGTGGEYAHAADTVEYTAVEIRPGLFMVYWTENILKSRVVHVEDYDAGRVWTNIANTDGTFEHMSGELKIVGDLKNH